MDYLRIYNELIERGKTRILEGYRETHHILPRCIGGGEEKENLVDLTAREHFIAHWLLKRIHPEKGKLANAFWMMCNLGNEKQGRNYKVSSRAYEEARIGSSLHMSLLWEDKDRRDKKSKEAKEMWVTPGYKQMMSVKLKEVFNKPGHREMYSVNLKNLWKDDAHREKQSSVRKLNWEKPEYRDKVSKSIKETYNNIDIRKKISDISKKNWESQEYRDKISKSLKEAYSNTEVREKICKLSSSEVIEIRKLFSTGMKMSDIAKMFKVGKSTIVGIKNGTRYSWVP